MIVRINVLILCSFVIITFTGRKKRYLLMNNTPSIMVVDDVEDNLVLFEVTLTSIGYRVIMARNGEEALEKVLSKPPDLILLDIVMPKMDGYQVARRLKEDKRTMIIPIIMLSGLTEVHDRVKAFEAGADDFLTKPVHTKELEARIKSLLKVKAYNDHMRSYQKALKEKISGKTEQLRTALSSFSRFVPTEFLKLLNRQNITDVKLGDHVLREMTILFSDIRSFTSLSEKMTPQENFNFLNSYLKRMNPFIWNNKGFIDKYVGDAIMALFPDGEESALSAAIEMIKHLPVYNTHRHNYGYAPIEIGIGIHSGTVMLGTIGHEIFMQGTVISDSVNLASRIEGFTKLYGVSLIVSSKIIFGLKDPTKYNFRFLDKVKVKGKDKPVSVFEVFEGDPLHLRERKIKTREKFEKGVYEYHSNNIEQAFEIFNDLWQSGNEDKPLDIYMKRSKYYLKHGTRMIFENT